MNLMTAQLENIEKSHEDRLEEADITRTKIPFIINPTDIGRDVPPPDNPKLQVQFYVEWVYACVSRNSNAVATAPLRLFVAKGDRTKKLRLPTRSITKEKRDRLERMSHLLPWTRKAAEIEEVTEHPFHQLLRNVNAFVNRFDLWELTEIYLELTGNAYWYMIEDESLSIPKQIWVLPSQNMRVVVDDKTFVKGYVYEMGATKIPFELHEIVHFKFASPTNLYYGYSPLSAAKEVVALNAQINIYENALFRNNAAPEGVLTTDGTLDDVEFERIRKMWKARYSGRSRMGKTAVLSSGLKYEKIAFSPRDLGYDRGKKYNREVIASVYGVPMSKLITENVNKANAEAGERQWIKDTIEPRLTRIEEKLNEQVLPRYDENLFVAYDDLLPEDTELGLKQRESRLKTFYSSVNEERTKDGLPPVPWGDVALGQGLWLPVGTAPPDEQNDAKAVQIAQGIYKKLTELKRKKANERALR